MSDITPTKAYLAAHAALTAADALDDATPCTCPEDTCTGACPGWAAREAYHAADRALDAARAAWLASDEPREYEIRDDQARWRVTSTPDEIEADAEASLRDGDWDTSDGPLYLVADAYPIDPITDEALNDAGTRVTVTIAQNEPDCAEGEAHAWRSPHSVVGGLRENPGVHGVGAGVVVREVCAHCGAYRVYESAAQDPGTGTYYASTHYEEADEDSLAWVERRRARAAQEMVA